MKRLLVTGASGLLGLHLALQEAEKFDVYGVVNHQRLVNTPFQIIQSDLSAVGEVRKVLDKVRPDILVHCAAMANIDECEKNPLLAEAVNGDLPGQLAGDAKKLGFQFVQISTDAVFDGAKGQYRETDMPNPLSVYATTKLKGEQAVLSENQWAVVARVNFYGWSLNGKRSLAEWFYNNLKAKNQVNGFTDVLFCPFMVTDLCEILMKMVQAELSGLYHVVSPECISKYEFGRAIANLFGFDTNLITPISVEQGGLAARRSPHLTLLPDKLQQDLRMELPGQEIGLKHFYDLERVNYPAMLRELAG